jgi:hypothetical protein
MVKKRGGLNLAVTSLRCRSTHPTLALSVPDIALTSDNIFALNKEIEQEVFFKGY